MKKYIYSLLVLAMATFTFSSCEDVPAPYNVPNQPETPEVDPNAKGSETNPYTVGEAIALIQAGSAPSSEVCVKGKITAVTYYNATYKSISYNIADEGSSEVLEVYSGKGLNGADFSAKTDLSVGQTVVVKGKIKAFTKTDGTVVNEIDQSSTIISIEGENTPDTPSTGEAKGTGTAADPFNSIAANKYTKALEADKTTEQEFYIKGKIQSIKDQFAAQYGNATFYIADDANSEQFYVFRTYYFGGEKWKEGNGELKVGDEVVICAKLVNFKGNTPETSQGGKLISVNGKTSIEGGSSTPDTPSVGEGVSIDGTTVILNNSSVTAGSSVTVDFSTFGYENAQKIETVTLSDGSTIAFDANGNKNAPAYYNATKGIRVYANSIITFTGKSNIAKIVMNCDAYNGTNYVGNETATVTFSGKTAVYTNTFTGTSGGGVQLRVKTIEIFYAK